MTTYTNHFFETFKKDIHSQNGEDGLVFELHRLYKQELPEVECTWVCEFGAWDGIHLSNTFALINKDPKVQIVYIEGDKTKYKSLTRTRDRFPENITSICAYISHDKNSQDRLDVVLSHTSIPKDFFLLSIDIDSFDYQVWESLTLYSPYVVIIEINSSIDSENPNYIHNPSLRMDGTAFTPMLKLAERKGYRFLAHTGNMIFLRDDFAKSLEEKKILSFPEDPYKCFRRDWMKGTA